MNTNDIQVSILVPIYKVEKFLDKTLDSIFTQTYPYLNYVFVNDCSPDKSLQVLIDSIKKYGIKEGQYTIINHERNEGIAVSRADCIAHATGEYVYFVDSDDWIDKDTVEQMVLATKNGTVDIVGCDFMKEYQSGDITCHHEDYAESCRENLYYYADSFIAIPKAFYHYVQYNQARVSLQTLWSVNMHIKGVGEVEEFCREKGIYNDDVEHKLILRKFNIKSNFLTKQLLDYHCYKQTFPEAKCIWREMNYSIKEKLKFWLAEHDLFLLLNYIQR